MVDWAAHKFVLVWLKNNLDNYQYNSAEARIIKEEMQKNQLESEEDTRQFAELYEQFLQLVEINPFTACNGEGEKAAILAKDYYYYFYPTKQNLLIPLGLQIESGVTNTEEKAAELQNRLMISLRECWESSDKKNTTHIDDNELVSQSDDYEFLLQHSLSAKSYIFVQIAVFLMSIFCLFGNVLLYMKKGFYPINSLKSIAYWSVTAIAALFLISSLMWIVREKKRRRVIETLKLLREKPDENKQENTAKNDNRNFRSVEGLTAILVNIGNQTFRRETYDTTRKDKIKLDSSNKMVENHAEPVQLSVLHTVRLVHVFTMIIVTVCCLLCMADVFPDTLGSIKNNISEELNRLPVLQSMMTREEVDDVLQDTNIQIVARKNTWGFKGNSGEVEKNTSIIAYEAGTRLTMLGCYQETEGDQIRVWFHERDAQGSDLYVAASDVGIEDANKVIPTSLRILDSQGNPKKIDNVQNLIDGSVLTAVEFDKGDIIQMSFLENSEIKAIYVLNGNLIVAPDSDSGIYQADFRVNDKETRTFLYDRTCDPNGYVMSIPENRINSLEIQVTKTTSDKDKCWITELVFCG